MSQGRLCVSIVFGARAGFSLDASHVFYQSVLLIFPLIGDKVGVVVSRVHDGYEAGLPLCSMAVTALSGEGSAPQLVKYKS